MASTSIVLNPPNFGYTLTTNFAYAPDSYTAQNYNMFYWDLGDGTTSTQISGNHIYPYSDNFLVGLTAYNVAGSTNTVVGLTSATSRVKVSFFNTNYNQGFVNATKFNFTTDVQLSGLGSGYNTYHWDFGDYATSREPNPIHLYNAPKNYKVTLTIYTSSGDSITDSNIIPINLYLNEDRKSVV